MARSIRVPKSANKGSKAACRRGWCPVQLGQTGKGNSCFWPDQFATVLPTRRLGEGARIQAPHRGLPFKSAGGAQCARSILQRTQAIAGCIGAASFIAPERNGAGRRRARCSRLSPARKSTPSWSPASAKASRIRPRRQARVGRLRRLDLRRGHRQVPGHEHRRIVPAHSRRQHQPRNQRRRSQRRHSRPEHQLHARAAEQRAGRDRVRRPGRRQRRTAKSPSTCSRPSCSRS